MQQRATHAEQHQGGVPLALADQRHPEPLGDDPDVLDGVVGEEPLQVVLADGEGDPQHAGDGPQQEHAAAPPGGDVEEAEKDPHHAVDAALQHQPGEHGGDVARGVGVRRGEPDVQRHDAGLEAEAEQRGQEDPGGGPTLRRERPRRREEEGAARPLQQGDHGEKRQGTQVGRDQVEDAGVAHLRLLVLRRQGEIGGQGHDLPDHQEEHRVAHQKKRAECRGEQPQEKGELADVPGVLPCRPVTDPVEGAAAGHQEYREQEERGERVDAELAGPEGKAGEQGEVLRDRDQQLPERSGATDQRARQHQGGGEALGAGGAPAHQQRQPRGPLAGDGEPEQGETTGRLAA